MEESIEVSKDGLKLEKDPNVAKCYPGDKDFKPADICQTNQKSGKKPEFILWGDSYAQTDMPAFFELSQEHGRNGYIFQRANCPPIFGILVKGDEGSEKCRAYNERVFNFLIAQKITNVFIVGSWTNWYKNPNLYYDEESWRTPSYKTYENISVAGTMWTINRLLDAGITPYFVINQPKMKFSAPHVLEVERRMGVRQSKARMPVEKYYKQRAEHLDVLLEGFKKMPVVVIDPLPLFCPDDFCIASLNGIPLYKDTGHLSVEGARFAKPLFEKYFKEGFDGK